MTTIGVGFCREESFTSRLVKHTIIFGEGSIMLWRYLTFHGFDMYCKIQGTMVARLYFEILQRNLFDTK